MSLINLDHPTPGKLQSYGLVTSCTINAITKKALNSL